MLCLLTVEVFCCLLQLVRENAALVGRLSQLGAGLRQLQGGRERELQEDASSLSLLRQQLNTLHSERWGTCSLLT